MEEFILRSAVERDREQIIKIWRESFGDSPGFIADILSPGLFSTAVGAEAEGRLRSVMFSFDGLSAGGVKATYLFALCTEEAFRGRGLGRATAEYAARCAEARGAQAVLLRPADSGLERWYAEALGARTVARCTTETVRPALSGGGKAREISAEEYLRLRSSPWRLSEGMINAQDCVHRHFGGAFLAVGSSLLCCEKSGGRILVREIISDDPEIALGAAAEHFGAESLDLLRPSAEGNALMLLPGKAEIEEIPFLPFTFD